MYHLLVVTVVVVVPTLPMENDTVARLIASNIFSNVTSFVPCNHLRNKILQHLLALAG